jgi:hypothetical protein
MDTIDILINEIKDMLIRLDRIKIESNKNKEREDRVLDVLNSIKTTSEQTKKAVMG